MQTLNIQLENRSYPIYIGEGLLSQILLIESHLKQKHVAVVTNTTVAPLYLDPLLTLLKERGKVIYLNAKPQHLAKRMAYDKDRPLLQQGNMLDTLNQLYKDRHPLYLNVASFVVDTGQQKTQTIIHKIESLLS